MEEKIEELVARMKAAGEDQDFIDATIAKLRGQPTPASEPKEEHVALTVADASAEDSSIDYVAAALEKHRNYNATEEQKAEAAARAAERVRELSDPANLRQSLVLDRLRQEEEGEGFSIGGVWESLTSGGGSSTAKHMARDTKAKEIVGNNLKEGSDLQSKAIESLLAKHNKGLPSDQRVREVGEDGEYTSEYYNWLEGLSDEDITQGKVDELASRYEDEYFDSNVEEEMEDRVALGITRSDSQKAEEELAKNAVKQLEDEKGKLIKNQKSITNGLKGLKVKYDGLGSLNDKLTTLDNRAKKITSIEYQDQESFDKASKELEAIRTQFKKLNEEYAGAGGLSLDELNSEREAYLKAYGRAEDAMEGFSGRDQDLGAYLDAMGRNYGLWANIGMGVASSFVKLGAAGAQIYKMAQDMPADLFSDVIPMLPDSLKPYASTIELGLGFMGRAMTNDVSGGVSHLRGEDPLGEVVERMWAWDESITNHMEKPGEFKDIEAWDLEGFGEWFGHLASTQAANTAVLFGTGGAALYVLGASATGAKFHDIEKEMEGYANLHEDNPMHNFKYTKAQQYSAAMLSGGFESVSEKVSFGQAKWVKSMMKDSMLMKRGFNNFLQRNFATKTGLYRNFYDPVEEGFTETLAELGNNMTDWLVLGKDVSLLDGMHESFMSGLFMSGVVYKAPLVGKNMVKAFQSSDASAEIADISLKIQRKTEMLNTYELSDENIKALEGDINKLVTKHTILINETINGVQNMDSGTRTKLINIDVELARLRRSNKDLASDPSLTKEQVQELQNDNTRDMSDLKASKDHLIAEANKVDNTSQIERTTTRAQKDWEKITGKPVRFFRANKASAGIKGRAFKKADVDFIEGQLESKRKALETAKGEDAAALQEDISKLEKQLNQVRNYSLDEMGSAQGFESPVTGNIFINTEVSAETGGVNVVNHELMHSVLKKTLADNPRAALAMGNAVDDFLGKLDPDEVASSTMAARLRAYQDSPAATRSEEKVTLFMDALVTGDIKITRSGNQKLGNAMRRAMQSAGLRDIKFETSEDVYNFITDFQASRKSIFFNKAIAKAAREGVKIGEGLLENVTQEQLDELAREEDSGDLKKSRARIKKVTKVSAKETVYEAVNKLAEGVKTNAEWVKRENIDKAVEALKPGGAISNLVRDPVRGMSAKEQNLTIQELRVRLKNFNPEAKRKTGSDETITFIEFVNSNIRFGRLDARLELAIAGAETKLTKSLDATTSEGKQAFEIEAETDINVQAFEDQDMSMAAQSRRTKLVEQGKSESDQYSGLRTELGLEKPMMDKVRKAVAKTFGTKLPDINSKKFKAALQKAYRTELKKPIQDMIGKGEAYNEFLAKNFPIVYKFLPKETLLQMERSVAADKRIFTKSERIIKTTEVDRLISEGLLPKETNRLSGPTLITKLPYPGSKKVMAYFRGKDMVDALGYEVGTSTLGTRKDKLAMEMGVELGFDATMETVQDPEVAERRESILELTGQAQAENDVSVMAKQIDRDPSIKFSKSSDLFAAQTMSLVKDVVDNGFETVFTEDGKLIEGYPAFGYTQKAIDFAYSLWDDGTLHAGDSIGFKAMVMLSDKFPQEVKDALKKDGTLKNNGNIIDGKGSLDRLYDASSALTIKLGAAIVNTIGYEVAGFKARVMNSPKKTKDKAETAKQGKTVYAKDENGNNIPGPFFERLQKLSEEVRKSTGVALPFGLDLKAVSIMNKNAGVESLFGKVQKILDMDISRDEKLVMLTKLQPEIDAASAANIKLAKHISTVLIKGVRDGSIDQVSALHLLQAQTNIVSGFRGLSGLSLITVLDGSQKPGENHPYYKRYFKELSKTMPKDKARVEAIKLTGYKGEHLAPNSNTMFKIAELFNEELTDTELSSKLDDIFMGHSQMHTTIGLTKTMDKEGGETNDTDFNRVKFLEQEYIDATVRADGTPYPIVLAEIEILKEVSRLKFSISKRNGGLGTMNRAIKASRSSTKKLIDGLAENDISDAVSGINPDEYSNIRFSKSHRAEYEKRLLKNNADIGTAKQAAAHIDALFNWVDSSEVPVKKKSKFEKLALHYMVNNKLRMPEDGYKVIEAERLAEEKKIDPFSFKNPNEIIERYAGEVTKKNPNPDQHLKENDNTGAFSNKREIGNGITVYDVENSSPGMFAVRNMVNEHFGKKSNPWCITQAIDGKLTDTASEYWDQYGTKQILFKDGKLLAMRTESIEGPLTDAGDIEFWSRDNVKFNEIPGNDYVDEQGREIRSSFNEKTGKDSGIIYGATKGSIESGKIEIYDTWIEGAEARWKARFKETGIKPQLYLEQVERYNKKGQLHGTQEQHISPAEMETGSYASSITLTKEYENGNFIGSRTDYGDGQGLGSFQEKLRAQHGDVMFSKSSKGITVLDFDDTLATTKSGVKARIPNPDGTPKPGRKVIFMAGGAGSGKGNVISKLGLKEAGYKMVNSDISLEWLKKNHGLPENQSDYTAEQRSQLSKLSAEARKIAKHKQGKFAGNGDGVVVDGTGGSIKMMGKLVEEFKAKGYDVSMIFVETSLEVAQQRNAARKERSLREGILNKNHEQVQGNKEAFKELFGETFNEVSTDKIGLNDALPKRFKDKVDSFTNSYENRRLDAEEFARDGADIKNMGGEFDFSEFNQVVEGETAPMFNKAMKLSGKYGTDNMFILTARSPEAAPAIKEFLDAQGLNIPLENITGLGQSEASAKANWIAEKIGEGYNDFYFADDATQNVEAVQDMLDQFDVKGKVQQARLKFSKSGPKKMSEIIDEGAMDLNTILEQTKGVDRKKVFSAAKARKRGKNKGRFKFFVPPSADDFAGLMYAFMGKGKQGEQHHQFFKENLFDPFSKGIRHLKQVQQAVANDLKELRKAMPDVRKKLDKTVPGTEYTHEDAIRVYNWVKAGFEVPGLSKTDKQALVDAVTNDASLSAFAQGVSAIGSTPGGLVDPGKHWLGGNIALDLKEALDVARGTYLQQWKENVDIMFNEANLNKIEAVYGSNFREALEDSLWRMEHGGNRSRGSGRLLTNFTNWIHGSIGTTMFLNARSAMLQMISNVNFVNWSDNNMIAAAKAFGNQPQYWKDVAMIFNSPFLKQRRSGIQTDVNAAELLAQIKDSKNQVKAATAYLLQLGFTPTQIADSFAIATGGATLYRNRMKTYLKEGMTQAEAETKAFEDMMEIAEETQQSTREDKISQQQASPLGKFILAFQNTPMQYNRIIKKASLDLVNGRGDPKVNISRIIYYGGIQNIIFYGLQQAMFAALFSDEEEEVFDKKSEKIMNGMVDTILRGSGIGGAVVATVKNVIIKFMKEEEKEKDDNFMTKANHANTLIEALNISPPIGIKARDLYGATQTWDFNRDVINHMSKTDIDNPAYEAISNAVEAVTNLPLNRLYSKYQNISESLNADNEMWQRVAMFLGWSSWNFGIKNQDVVTAKGEVKVIKAAEAEERKEMKKRAKAVEKMAEEEIIIKDNLLDQKEEREEGQEDIKCAAVSKSGARCGAKVKGGGNFCTVHEKAPQRASGEKTQCSHIKPNGDRCKMQTGSQSGKCYYHD